MAPSVFPKEDLPSGGVIWGSPREYDGWEKGLSRREGWEQLGFFTLLGCWGPFLARALSRQTYVSVDSEPGVSIRGDSVDRTASLRPEIAPAESRHQHHRDDRVSWPPAVDVLLCHGQAMHTLCSPQPPKPAKSCSIQCSAGSLKACARGGTDPTAASQGQPVQGRMGNQCVIGAIGSVWSPRK